MTFRPTSEPDAASAGKSDKAAADVTHAGSPRFEQLTTDQLDAHQKPLGEQITRVSSLGLGGPYNAILRSPVMGQRLFDLLYYLRWNSSLPLRLTEFAILIVARHWSSQVEWYAHAPMAIRAGLSTTVVADLNARKRPAGMQDDESVVFDLATELTEGHDLSDATFRRARALFSEQQIVDLTTTCGTYVTVAMLLAMARQGIPAGAVSSMNVLPL